MNFIFDFDGTIVDSFDYILEFLSNQAGRDKPVGEEAESFRRKSMKDMGLQLGIAWWRLPSLYFKGRRVMRKRMDNLHAFSGMDEVIKNLSDAGNRLFIISSNSTRNIKRFLTSAGLKPYFKATWGGAGILGKMNLIKQMRFRYRIKGDIYYVGDEVSDVVAAKAVGAKTIAVTWGFADQEALANSNPDFLVDTPKELLEIKV